MAGDDLHVVRSPAILAAGPVLGINSDAESFSRARPGLRGLFFSILRRSVRFQRTEQSSRCSCYFVNGSRERRLVGLRRFIKAGDLSHELQRRSSNLVLINGRIEIEKSLNISAH